MFLRAISKHCTLSSSGITRPRNRKEFNVFTRADFGCSSKTERTASPMERRTKPNSSANLLATAMERAPCNIALEYSAIISPCKLAKILTGSFARLWRSDNGKANGNNWLGRRLLEIGHRVMHEEVSVLGSCHKVDVAAVDGWECWVARSLHGLNAVSIFQLVHTMARVI